MRLKQNWMLRPEAVTHSSHSQNEKNKKMVLRIFFSFFCWQPATKRLLWGVLLIFSKWRCERSRRLRNLCSKMDWWQEQKSTFFGENWRESWKGSLKMDSCAVVLPVICCRSDGVDHRSFQFWNLNLRKSYPYKKNKDFIVQMASLR